MKFLVFLTTLLVVGLVHGSSVHILDQDNESIGNIVQQVCWHAKGTSKQISKISTVHQIADYLGAVSAEDKLASCSRVYLNSVRDLAKLVSTSNDNVCSEEKIAAIQHFHKSYVLKGSQRTGEAPKVLVTFFYHYVQSIVDICSNEAAGSLSALEGLPETNTNDVDNLLAELTGKTGVSSSGSLEYKDMFLIWSIVDMLPLRSQHKIEKYIFNGEKRVYMAAKKAEAMTKMQEFCHTEAKPLYSHSLLSTVKLIEMGYYPSSSQFLEQLNNKHARRLYELTKICETLLPISVVEQTAQSGSEMVLLTHQEVQDLGLTDIQAHSIVTENPCTRCSIADVDYLASVNTVDAAPVAKRVKGNVKSRKSAVSRLLKAMVKSAKTSIKGNLKKLFSGEASEDLENIDENQLELFDVAEEHDHEDRVERSKRGLKKIWNGITWVVGKVLLIIFYFVWGIVTFYLFIPASLIYRFIAHFTGKDPHPVVDVLETGLGVFTRVRNGL